MGAGVGMLYYVGGVGMVKGEDLPGLGLGHLAGMTVQSRGCGSGPDGGAGCVFSVREPEGLAARWAGLAGGLGAGQVGYWPERQVWTCCGGYWVGWATGAQPGPEALVRPRLVPMGREVVLGDGRAWMMPTLDEVPHGFSFGPEGQLVTSVAPAWQGAADAVGLLGRWVHGGEAVAWERLVGALAALLGVNYRVGLGEVVALGLVDSELASVAALHALRAEDLKAVEEALSEKNGQGRAEAAPG